MKDPTKAGAVMQTDFLITPLEDSNPWLKMLIYEPFGTGKTTLAGTSVDVPGMEQVLMIDIESGSTSIKESDRIINKDNIDVVRISNFKQLAKIHEYLKAHCRYRDNPNDIDKLYAVESKYKGPNVNKDKLTHYRTVIVDSLSELDMLCMYELLGFSTDMSLDSALVDGDMEVAEWSEFRKNNQMMNLVLRAYRDLPVNVLLVCHEKYTQDEMKKFHYSPSLTGKLSDQVQGIVDVVGCLRVGAVAEGQKEAPRRLYVQPVGKFDAKNRKAAFKESYFDNPTMPLIMRSFNGNRKTTK